MPGLSFNPKENNLNQTGRSPGLWIITLLLLPVNQMTVDSIKKSSPFTVAGPRWIFSTFGQKHANHQSSLLTSTLSSMKDLFEYAINFINYIVLAPVRQ